MKKLIITILSLSFLFASQSVVAQKHTESAIGPAPRSIVILITKHLKALKNKNKVGVQSTMVGELPVNGFNIGMPPMIQDSVFSMHAYDLNPNDLYVAVQSSKRFPKAATSIPLKSVSKVYRALKMAGKDPNYFMIFYVKNAKGYKIAMP